jgi:hypothetical protein
MSGAGGSLAGLRSLPVRTLVLPTLLVAGAALASTAVRLDAPVLTAAATDVVDGNVVSTSSVWTETIAASSPTSWSRSATPGRGARPTDHRGAAGGERDGIGQRVSGVAP